MKKSKVVLAATGGVIVLATLVMAALVWSAFSARTAAIEGGDDTEGLEAVVAQAERLSRKPVYPNAASVKAVESNEAAVVAWRDEANTLAARGDRTYRKLTASEFKSFIEKEAKRMLALPGGVSGAILKSDFTFGPFKETVVDGKMPADDPARIAELQRRWDDVATIIEAFSAAGACEVRDVQLKVQKVDENAAEEQANAGKKRKGARKAAKRAEQEAAKKAVSRNCYAITFTARPAAFVKCLNALATSERFMVVEDFSFVRETDVIAAAFGGGESGAKAAESAGGGRRGRRGRAQAAVVEKKESDAEKTGLVTDPQIDAPIKIDLTVSVYDFGSLADDASDATKAAGEGK